MWAVALRTEQTYFVMRSYFILCSSVVAYAAAFLLFNSNNLSLHSSTSLYNIEGNWQKVKEGGSATGKYKRRVINNMRPPHAIWRALLVPCKKGAAKTNTLNKQLSVRSGYSSCHLSSFSCCNK